jgi:hypothetical protein
MNVRLSLLMPLLALLLAGCTRYASDVCEPESHPGPPPAYEMCGYRFTYEEERARLVVSQVGSPSLAWRDLTLQSDPPVRVALGREAQLGDPVTPLSLDRLASANIQLHDKIYVCLDSPPADNSTVMLGLMPRNSRLWFGEALHIQRCNAGSAITS